MIERKDEVVLNDELMQLADRPLEHMKGSKRHPTIGNNVTIYSGASILGGNTVIEDDVVIGGNAFVTESVSKGSRVVFEN